MPLPAVGHEMLATSCCLRQRVGGGLGGWHNILERAALDAGCSRGAGANTLAEGRAGTGEVAELHKTAGADCELHIELEQRARETERGRP